MGSSFEITMPNGARVVGSYSITMPSCTPSTASAMCHQHGVRVPVVILVEGAAQFSMWQPSSSCGCTRNHSPCSRSSCGWALTATDSTSRVMVASGGSRRPWRGSPCRSRSPPCCRGPGATGDGRRRAGGHDGGLAEDARAAVVAAETHRVLVVATGGSGPRTSP